MNGRFCIIMRDAKLAFCILSFSFVSMAEVADAVVSNTTEKSSRFKSGC